MIAALRAAVATALVLAPELSSAQATQLQGDALVQALRSGGYVILMRHAATEAKLDSDTVDLGDCATQRNLSPEGRAAARTIGERVAKLGLPIGDVAASPYCRARESGELIFGHADVMRGLGDHAVKDAAARADAASALKPLLAALPAPGKDNVVITHGFNAKAVTGLDLLEAEAVVVKPDGQGSFTIVGDIKADAWNSL